MSATCSPRKLPWHNRTTRQDVTTAVHRDIDTAGRHGYPDISPHMRASMHPRVLLRYKHQPIVDLFRNARVRSRGMAECKLHARSLRGVSKTFFMKLHC